MAGEDGTTPARRQYLELKGRHPDALLWFRMGDFYETFDGDAEVMARDLHITLTSREFGRGNRVPMAGVPHHAAASYLRRLLAKGHRVAICEQLSEAGKGLVERDVVRVLTPGTVVEGALLQAKENNYLVALCPGREGIGLAYVDVTTGEFAVSQFGPDEEAALAAELARLDPAECLMPEGREPAVLPGCPLTPCPRRWFAETNARERLRGRFDVVTLEPFGCDDLRLAIGAAGATLAYVESANRDLARLLRGLRTEPPGSHMALDPATRRNLDLTRASRAGGRTGTLLHVLDRTRTPMGGRLLRRWLGAPLLDLGELGRRGDVVAALVADGELRASLQAQLERAGDLERTAARARQGSATGRDLLALAGGLGVARECGARAAAGGGEAADALRALAARLDGVEAVAGLVGRAVAGEGERLIRPGYHAELDGMGRIIAEAQATLVSLERRLRERTGIRSLKVGYNKVFGYYIEVTRSNLQHVPADFLRRQTLANAERYITDELRDCEAAILRAEEGVGQLDEAVFAEVRETVGAASGRILLTAAALAELDVLAAFAQVAAERGYVRPRLDEGGDLEIRGGRHPSVEASLEDGAFIANDCVLGLGAWGTGLGDKADAGGQRDMPAKPGAPSPKPRVLLITGPNMAGKSTYLRQVALIVLMAQVGSFVPAAAARIGLVDRIFTRVGAHDDLAAGASTFLVEMTETAAILRHATARSLLVFDEIGRGTSTLDGLAIAQAIVEDVHERIGARTLFATHYHELIALAERLPHLANANAAAVEEGGRVVFLHRIRSGGADRSYGIHVAAIAGVPSHVTERARALLAEMEATPRALPAPVVAPPPAQPREPVAAEIGLSGALRSIDLARTTPLDALNILARLQEQATEERLPLRLVGDVPSSYRTGAE